MSSDRPLPNRVKAFRLGRGWSQEELARRAGISRAAVSAIEIERLVPSVAAALGLARALASRVEELFGPDAASDAGPSWAWPPSQVPCRFWQARVSDGVLCFPVETTAAGMVPHDGIYESGVWKWSTAVAPDQTLVLATCDPAAGLLAAECARVGGFRLLVLNRSSRNALDLLGRGLVDVAGIHLASVSEPEGNFVEVKQALGEGFALLKYVSWEEGLAMANRISPTSVRGLIHSKLRWVGREPGSGARKCLEEVLEGHPLPRRMAHDHRGVAEAIRCGWADIGVCLRLTSEEARLKFLVVRKESYELCFREAMSPDPRIRALLQVARSTAFRKSLSELPGYDSSGMGEIHSS